MVGISSSVPDVSFGRYRSDVARNLVTDNGVFPVRVIVVKDTLLSKGGIAFTEPKDWMFHTISHTWSMVIRQLSIDIGSELEQQGAEIGYNDVFNRANLDGRPGYAHLLEFLKILREDGVEKVWFDALCINQVDNEEKRREILHMGAFYFHSLGCYVMVHGFGRGFGIVDDDGHLPRWFSRVWTFQEFLLPKILSFVGELSTTYFHDIVRQVRNEHVMAFCACKKETSLVWPWGFANPMVAGSKWSEDYEERVRWCNDILPGAVEVADEMEFWRLLHSSKYGCTHGRFQRIESVQNGANEDHDHEEKKLYLIDRDSYVYLLNCTKGLQVGGVRAEVRELMSRFEMVYKGGHPAIVKEISLRNCSNEEDRVLSVLGLLGLDGKMKQLRAERTLEEQLVEMGKAMAKCSMGDLMKLCASFAMPYPMQGLSWAPHFVIIHQDFHPLARRKPKARPGRSPEEEVLQQLESFHHCVARVSVCAKGLTLSCYTVKGRLIPFLRHALKCTTRGCCSCPKQQYTPTSVLEISQGHALPFNSFPTCDGQLVFLSALLSNHSQVVAPNAYFHGGLVLDLHTPVSDTIHKTLLKALESLQFDVWLLLLGTFQEKQNFSNYERVVHVFMVCVGESSENLHKIGIVQMLPSYTRLNDGTSFINRDSFHNMECTIGGYGKTIAYSWVSNQIDNL